MPTALTGHEFIEKVIPVQSNGQPSAVPLQGGTIGAYGGVSVAKIAGVLTLPVATQANFASTTTLANVSGISATLDAGVTYSFFGSFPISSGSSGGVQLALGTSDTLSVTSLSLNGKFYTAAGVAVANTTVLAGGVGSTATVVLAELAGSFVVNTAGTIVLQASQNASNATTTSLLINGFLRLLKDN